MGFNFAKYSSAYAGILSLCSCAAGGDVKLEPKFEDPSFIPAPKENPKESGGDAFHILYIGNSITRHGICLEPLKWDHIAGMAASCEAKDYAHLLGALIQGTMPNRKVVLHFDNVNECLRKPGGAMINKSLKKPDLVIIQTGEHEGPLKTKEEVAQIYERQLIAPACGLNPRPIVLAAGVWYVTKGEPYRGWVKNIDDAYREVCERHGVHYVSVESLATDPSCRGWGEHNGVKWHPNDKGMEGYARLLFKAFQKEKSK